MADLMQGSSEYESGTLDTAAVLVNNVSPMNANQPNGLADAIIQMQHVLGAGPDLVGTLADLATRLAVQMSAAGILLPIGSIILHCGALPSLFINAFGQEETRTGVTANLFSVCGVVFGPGNGTSTFNVPNLQGRVPVGIGSSVGGGVSGTGVVTGGAALSTVLMGAWRGEETHLLSLSELPVINFTVNDPGHGHTQRGGVVGGGASQVNTPLDGSGDAPANTATQTGTTNNSTGITISPVGSGNTHNILRPELGLRYIIKY